VGRESCRCYLFLGIEEGIDGNPKNSGDFDQPTGADAIGPQLVFLKLLVSDAKLTCEVPQRHFDASSVDADRRADTRVRRA
jgi:hypothetical protein